MKPVPSCPGYFASEDGHIYRNGRPLKAQSNGRGYLKIKVSVENVQWDEYIHRMVCEAYHGPCPPDHECRHLDGIRPNNIPTNVQWATKAINESDKLPHGTLQRGERNGISKLSEWMVIEARILAANGCSVKEIARDWGVGYQGLKDAVFGRRWKHVPGALIPGETKVRDPDTGQFTTAPRH